METKFNIFEVIASQSLGLKKVDKFAVSLTKSFKPTQAGSLEKASDLAFWLFVYGQNELSLSVCQSLGTIPFNGNYNLWTWVEMALALEAKLLALAGQSSQAQKPVASIRASFDVGDEPLRTIKTRALGRRLDGELLQADAIAEAEKEGDRKAEMDYRFAHLKELIYIEVLGGSNTQPVAEIQRKIQRNVEILAQH